jgi:hypothetical protein
VRNSDAEDITFEGVKAPSSLNVNAKLTSLKYFEVSIVGGIDIMRGVDCEFKFFFKTDQAAKIALDHRPHSRLTHEHSRVEGGEEVLMWFESLTYIQVLRITRNATRSPAFLTLLIGQLVHAGSCTTGAHWKRDVSAFGGVFGPPFAFRTLLISPPVTNFTLHGLPRYFPCPGTHPAIYKFPRLEDSTTVLPDLQRFPQHILEGGLPQSNDIFAIIFF